MSTSATNLELKRLSDFQKSIHFDKLDPETGERVDPETGEPCVIDRNTHFNKEFSMVSWYSTIPNKMQSSGENEDIVYTPNSTFHYLMYADLRPYFPAIRVKSKWASKIMICWTHNPATSII